MSQHTEQFVVIPRAEINPNQLSSRVALFDRDGVPIDLDVQDLRLGGQELPDVEDRQFGSIYYLEGTGELLYWFDNGSGGAYIAISKSAQSGFIRVKDDVYDDQNTLSTPFFQYTTIPNNASTYNTDGAPLDGPLWWDSSTSKFNPILANTAFTMNLTAQLDTAETEPLLAVVMNVNGVRLHQPIRNIRTTTQLFQFEPVNFFSDANMVTHGVTFEIFSLTNNVTLHSFEMVFERRAR